MSFPRTCTGFPLAPWAYGPALRRVKAALAVLVAGAALAALPVPAAAQAAEPVRITAFGDSLTAGYNLPHEAAFPNQLQAALAEQGLNAAVANAGVSGDTTAGGLARLDWMLAGAPPDVVIVELGANDALRGLPPAQVEKNLDAILGRLKAEGVTVVLAGMLAPPNMGEDYGAAFNALYPRLAKRYDVAFYPFFLDGVAARAEYLQGDGMHPTAEGVAEIVRRILPTVTGAVEAHRAAARNATR